MRCRPCAGLPWRLEYEGGLKFRCRPKVWATTMIVTLAPCSASISLPELLFPEALARDETSNPVVRRFELIQQGA